MKFYLDTSFILAVVIDDAHSEAARRVWNEISTGAVVSDLASVEFGAVISRGVRTRALTEAGARTALDDFDLIHGNCGLLAMATRISNSPRGSCAISPPNWPRRMHCISLQR